MYRLKQLTLLAGDLLTLYAGLYLALWLRFLELPGKKLDELIGPMSQLFVVAVIIAFIAGLYDLGRTKNSWRFFQRVMLSGLVWMGIGIVYFYIKQNIGVAPKTILLLTAFTGFGLLTIWRFFYNKYISTNIWQTNLLFVGITDETKELIELLNKEPQRGYFVTGIIAENYAQMPTGICSGASIGEINAKMPGRLANLIVIAPAKASDENLLKELYQHLFKQTGIINLADFYEEIMGRIPPFTFSEGWFIAHLQEQQKKVYDRFRILLDYIFGILIGIFFIITYPFIALAIKLNSKGQVFFTQERVGRMGEVFKVYKYRTMKALNADGSAEINGAQFASANDSRITGVGKFLRRTRLDEIPQSINILKGEMSIIGPRPERPEFVRQLTEKMPYYSLRHMIKPGLTGWAQVHNSYYGTIEENLRKLEYDLFYIKNRGLVLDLSVMLRTINIILRMMGR
jgi:exopolysaccharide biosynthesis polyprenyl glycosylphosphotransferase